MKAFPYEQNKLFYTGLVLVFFALLNMTIGAHFVFFSSYLEYLLATGTTYSPLAAMITKQLGALYVVLNILVGLIGVHFMFQTKKHGHKY